MGKRRREGRARALAVIARHGKDGASALDIGKAIAAVHPRGRRMSMVGKEALGLAEAARLVRVGLAVATRNNRFMLAQLGDKAVPPVVRVEDFPKPGFMRVPNPPWRGRGG